MAIEEKVLLEVDTLGSESINSIKEKIKALKKEVNETKIATKEWDEKTAALANVQDTLNRVLTISKNSVQAADGSFTALNQKLGVLKKAWKDAGSEAERANLAKQINEVKGELNAMNESIGNFQHNVGNYAGAMKEVFGGAINSVIGSLEKANSTLKMLYTNPMFALVAGAAAVVMGIVKAIKSSEEAMQRVNVLLAPMKVLSDAVLNVFQKLAGHLLSAFEGIGKWLGKMLDRLSEGNPKLAEWNEKLKEGVAIQKEANALEKEGRENAVKNARDQLAISELRAKANDKEKYSAQERLKFVREANRLELAISQRNREEAERRLRVMQEEAKRAENNAETNEAIANQQIAVYNAQKAYFEKSRELLGQENALLAEIQGNAQKVTELINKGLIESNKARQKYIDEGRKANHEQMKLQAEDAMEWFELMLEQDEAELAIMVESDMKKIEQTKKTEEARKAILWESMRATSAILGSIADLYEANGKADEKAQKKAKGLRIAGATIDMLGGVVTAISSAMQLGPIAGPIVGAINAAVVTAAGVANIAKIKNTDVSGNSEPSVSPDMGARVSAPAVIQQVPVTRSLTGASEEDRLNQIANNTGKDQRVVLVYSDVEAAGRRVEVQQSETSF